MPFRSGPSRRSLLAAMGGAMVSATSRADDQITLPPLVIGVLTDTSGYGVSVSGPPLVQAVRQAIEDAGELPGPRQVDVLTESYLLKPDDAVAIAGRWFDQGVAAVVDVPGTAAALAVQALAKARQRTYLSTGCVSPDLTGRACSPFGSSWNLDSISVSNALAKAAAKAGAKTWFLVAPDTALGLALHDDAIRAIEAGGGKIVGQSRHPDAMTDYTSVVAQALASGAKAIGLLDINEALSVQLGQFQDGGLFGDGRFVCAFLPSIADIHAAGAKAAKGLLIASPFYWDQNEQARLFARRFMAATGQMPGAAHAGAYVAIRHFLRAVVATEGLEAGPIAEEMRRAPAYFFGRSGKLRLDGRLSIDLSLLRAKPPEALKGEWDHFEPVGIIPAADVFRPLSQAGCPLSL